MYSILFQICNETSQANLKIPYLTINNLLALIYSLRQKKFFEVLSSSRFPSVYSFKDFYSSRCKGSTGSL